MHFKFRLEQLYFVYFYTSKSKNKIQMAKWQERAELLFKKEGLENLRNSNVLVVGLGGVGSFAAEFLARAGVGKMTIVDGDVVDITNVNQIGRASCRERVLQVV